MSDLLNSASLVLIPSGYKEDTVYSVVPSDGSGDLSFTRASNGTRVNSAGLVEDCPWNFNNNSETFSGAGWGTDGTSTATDNFTTAPNGTMTAAKVVSNVSNGYAYKGLPVNTGFYTFSLYVKASVNTTIAISFDAGSVVKNVTTEWQRFEFAYNVASSGTQYIVYGGLATGVNYFLWGAQLNIGSTAKPYFPTTDRLNVPRLTYQNGGGGCPSLLLEKQSTNLALYSEQFDNASWIKSNITVTANTAISPDGTQNADKVSFTAAAYPQLITTFTGTATTTYTFSVYLKLVSGTPTPKLELYGAGVINVTSSPTFTNEWVRYTITGTTTNAGSFSIYLGFDYVASATGEALIWGAQLEASSYATSYIPTTSSSATRVADACYKTGISSLIGQTEGTLFLDFEKTNNDNVGLGGYFRIDLNDGTIDNRILFGFDLNNINATVVSGGSVVANISTSGVQTQTRIKAAFSYKANDFILYVNGVQIGVDLSGSVPSGMANFNWGINQTTVTQTSAIINAQSFFKTRLTNAQLASLTTI